MASRDPRRRDARLLSIVRRFRRPPPTANTRGRPGFWTLAGVGAGLFALGAALAWLATLVWPSLVTTTPTLKPVIDRFVELRAKGDPGAWAMLLPPPADADAPVTEEEAEAIQADAFLRSDLIIVTVGPGEWLPGGRRRDDPAWFTLVTHGGATGPAVRVREGGRVGSTGRRMMWNPELVVEVRDGRVRAVRPQLHEETPAR